MEYKIMETTKIAVPLIKMNRLTGVQNIPFLNILIFDA
jgi:hypothetical protein